MAIRLGFGLRTRWRRLRMRNAVDHDYLEGALLSELLHRPAAPLKTRAPQAHAPLDVAFVVPFFQRGGGGHTTIANLVRGLEARGHRCSLWIDDAGQRWREGGEAAERAFRDWFGPFGAAVRYGFAGWTGADVVLATGWQTVARVRVLENAAARAYLVQDHEPEFFGTSAQRLWAEDSYRHGLYAITAGRWLAEVMSERYGMPATPFDLGVAHGTYHQRPDVTRRGNAVAVYARATTPRRAVPIALAALAELRRRRPATEVWLFGDPQPAGADFPVRELGVVSGERLARVYSEATVGLVLSMTNYSLVPQEMLACGLPCVELGLPSVLAAFGRDGGVETAAPDPYAIADALERLLGDPQLRAQRVAEGTMLLRSRTWDAAAAQVEQGLRAALAYSRD